MEINDLTPEEIAELKAEFEGNEDSGDSGLSNIVSSPRDLPPPSQEEVSEEEAVYRGAASGVTQGFAPNIAGAVGAAKDVVTGDADLSEYGEAYIRHRNDSQDAFDASKAKNPELFDAAEIGTSVATSLTHPALAITQAGLAGVGYSRHLKRSEMISLEQGLNAGLTGAGIALGATAAGKGVSMAMKGGQAAIKSLSSGTVAEAIGIRGVFDKIHLGRKLRSQGRDMSEWSDNLYKMKTSNNKPLFAPQQSFEETKDKIITLQQEKGNQIGQILKTVDEEVGKAIDPELLHKRYLYNHVRPLKNSDDPGTQKIAQNLEDWLNGIFKESTDKIDKDTGKVILKYKENFDLNRLHTVKTDIAHRNLDAVGRVKYSDNVAHKINEVENKIVGQMSGDLEGIVNNSNLNISNPDLLAAYKQAKIDYGDLSDARITILKQVDEVNATGAVKQLKDILNVRGLMTGALAKSVGIGAAPAVVAAGAMNMFLSSAQAPATLAVSMKKLSEKFTANPEKYSKIAHKIIQGAGTSHAALGQSLTEAQSLIALEDMPVSRSSQEVIGRKDAILTVLQQNEKYTEAKALRTAIDNEDQNSIGLIMSALSQDPVMRKLIKPGIGFDGKAITDQEVQSIENQINSKYKLRQRKQLLQEFRQTRNIPDLSVEVAPKRTLQYNKIANKLQRKD